MGAPDEVFIAKTVLHQKLACYRPVVQWGLESMYLKKVAVRNFRRLKDVEIDFEDRETIFVGPNNSGKTSATAAMRSFLSNREFKVHDFSLCSLTKINLFDNAAVTSLPHIALDLWFHINPDAIEFGTAFALATDFTGDFSEVGMRCCLEVDDHQELWEKYSEAFPLREDGSRKKSLVDFLALPGILKSHFKVCYYSLEKREAEVVETPLETSEGRKTLSALLRVDFVDAQRNIDDENATRSNKLSEAFAAYYQRNLEQATTAEEAVAVIEQNNDNLTAHYRLHFQPLMDIISELGLPSKNDRAMRIVSTLSSEVALKGSSELFYIDDTSSHQLPEAYNGLGFKNLVFMAIQIDNFYKQWLATVENRPLCQVIFIEEPEVHLHAQVQQTFIKKMWQVLTKSADADLPRPQLTVTTHSSHVLDAVDFSKIRYFRRVDLLDEDTGSAYPGSIVRNLKEFQPEALDVGGQEVTAAESISFLKKYLRLTHCDLFFADAAILVEGAVEKLLLPKMIDLEADGLNSKYLTILEVGGAYSMRFASLLDFLGVPYLVITDIDSVDPHDGRKGCIATLAGAVTSNASIKFFFNGCESIADLNAVLDGDHIQAENNRFVAYQKAVEIEYGGAPHWFHGRTLEEAFVYENHKLFSEGTLSIGKDIPEDALEFHDVVWKRIKSSTFKKTEFAMDVLAVDPPAAVADLADINLDDGEVAEELGVPAEEAAAEVAPLATEAAPWVVPRYISTGLSWLETRLSEEPVDGGADV